jgi:hypothetical protein
MKPEFLYPLRMDNDEYNSLSPEQRRATDTLCDDVYYYDIFLKGLIRLLIMIKEYGYSITESNDKTIMSNIYEFLYHTKPNISAWQNVEVNDFINYANELDNLNVSAFYNNKDEPIFSRNIYSIDSFGDVNILEALYHYLNIKDERIPAVEKRFIVSMFNGEIPVDEPNGKVINLPNELLEIIETLFVSEGNLSRIKFILLSAFYNNVNLESESSRTGQPRTYDVEPMIGDNNYIERNELSVFGGRRRTLRKRPRKTRKHRKTHYKKSHKKRSRRTRQNRYF